MGFHKKHGIWEKPVVFFMADGQIRVKWGQIFNLTLKWRASWLIHVWMIMNSHLEALIISTWMLTFNFTQGHLKSNEVKFIKIRILKFIFVKSNFDQIKASWSWKYSVRSYNFPTKKSDFGDQITNSGGFWVEIQTWCKLDK